MHKTLLRVAIGLALLAQPSVSQTVTPPSTGNGGGGSGTVTSVLVAGTANQITATGTCSGTTTVSCTFSIPSGFVLPGTIDGLTITTTTGTITIANAKTLTVNNTVTLTGTDATTYNFPSPASVTDGDCAKLTKSGSTVGIADAGVGACGSSSGTVSSIATTSPITGGPITTTGTIACATCATASGLTANIIPKISTSPGLANSSITDNGTTVASTEPITAPSVSTGTSPPSLVWFTGTAGIYGYGNGTCTGTVPAAAGFFCDNAAVPQWLLSSGNLNFIMSGGDINTSNQVTVTHLASALPVAQGGTGLGSGTSGGVPCYTGSTTIASSAALTANAVLIGGGVGVCPSSTTTGTGVLTALGVNVGSAGALVTLGGALGTPSSGVATNITGLPTAGLVANAVTSAKMAVVNTYRTCDIPINDTSGSAITSGQMGPQSRVCFIPAASTIVEMDVNADAGTPNIIVGRNHAGTIANIVSGALATAASGGIACTNTGGTTGINGATTCSSTLQNTSLSAGDYLELVSGTPGGTAKFFVAHVIYTVN